MKEARIVGKSRILQVAANGVHKLRFPLPLLLTASLLDMFVLCLASLQLWARGCGFLYALLGCAGFSSFALVGSALLFFARRALGSARARALGDDHRFPSDRDRHCRARSFDALRIR